LERGVIRIALTVRLSEIHTAGEVFTLDSDFRIYREGDGRTPESARLCRENIS